MREEGHKPRRQAEEADPVGGADLSERRAPRRTLICVACEHELGDAEARVEVAGRHAHTCVNPAGIVFHIGCWRGMKGVERQGPPVAEHSWFAGYAWQIALCAKCGIHLGWAFRGEGLEPFWGLISGRVAERER